MSLAWNSIIDIIQDTVYLLRNDDFSQPLKPYLRYGDQVNRFIAMPAYVGGNIDAAGIKWIASFPGNIEHKLPRANSVTILNDPSTGITQCVINTSLISEIRTAAVSGLLIREYIKKRKLSHYHIGIVGFGPIGQQHLAMLHALFSGSSYTISIFDVNFQQKKIHADNSEKNVRMVSSWEECYLDADIFFTCTVSSGRYIDKKPKSGALLMNVSLRDFKPLTLDFMDHIIVDDWEEVCRQNTDIEQMHLERGLKKTQTLSLQEMVCSDFFQQKPDTETVMFNPMGMAVFDIALAKEFYKAARLQGIGQDLDN